MYALRFRLIRQSGVVNASILRGVFAKAPALLYKLF